LTNSDLFDAVTVEVIESSRIPKPRELFGANAPESAKPSWLHRDAKRCGFSVFKLLGRVTVGKFVDEELERLYCFRLTRARAPTSSRGIARKRARQGDASIDPLKYRCKRGAGEGTHHAGSGACAAHGGNNYGRHFDGVMENSNRASLARYDIVNALLGQSPDGLWRTLLGELDILDEIVTQRLLVDQYLRQECLDEDGLVHPVVDGSVIETALGMLDGVAKNVERAKRIENSTALTRAHVLYLIDALTTLGKRYVPPEKLEDYGKDLLSSFGLNVSGVQTLLEPGDRGEAFEIARVVDAEVDAEG
jgi:hypothetical protein